MTFCGIRYHHQNVISERKIQTITLGYRTFLLHAKRYCPDPITTILWPYALKAFAGILNLLNVDDDGITPVEKFLGTTTDITLKITTNWSFQFMS